MKNVKGVVVYFVFIAFCINCTSCITTPAPVEEYNLARAALDAARSFEAARFASGYWYQADEAYQAGKKSFEQRDYADAKEYFEKAKKSAEKAENTARYLRMKSGEVF